MAALIDEANLDLASTPGLPPPVPAASPPTPPSCIPTAQRARLIHGVHTEVLVQSFADRLLVVLTQLGKIGCMIQVSPPPPTLPSALPLAAASPSTSLLASLPPPHPSTVLSPLFGVPPTPHYASLHDLYASQIGAIIFHASKESDGPGAVDELAGPGGAGDSKPVVLGIGLKMKPPTDDEEEGITGDERETFSQVMEMVLECLG
ncbi:hypothetical protein JCM8547_004933 [Rhodosporidiobolus lusitaniae]